MVSRALASSSTGSIMALARSIRVADEAMGMLLYSLEGELVAGVESHFKKIDEVPLVSSSWRF